MKELKIQLPVDKLPKKWFNIIPDLPKPLPPPKEPENSLKPESKEEYPKKPLKQMIQEF